MAVHAVQVRVQAIKGDDCLQTEVHADVCMAAMQCCTAYTGTERGGGTFARPYDSSNQNLFLSPTGKHTSGVSAAWCETRASPNCWLWSQQ